MVRNISALVESNVNTGLLQKGASSRWGYFLPTAACLDEVQRLVTSGKVGPNFAVASIKSFFEN